MKCQLPLRFIREFVHSRETAAFVIRQVKLLGGASRAPFQMQVKVVCVCNQICNVICVYIVS